MVMCPNCVDRELVFQDDSFDHAFGVEIIKFFYCEFCDYQVDAGEVENE
jgi:hypothetical protein